jgi:hypothetical protein
VIYTRLGSKTILSDSWDISICSCSRLCFLFLRARACHDNFFVCSVFSNVTSFRLLVKLVVSIVAVRDVNKKKVHGILLIGKKKDKSNTIRRAVRNKIPRADVLLKTNNVCFRKKKKSVGSNVDNR